MSDVGRMNHFISGLNHDLTCYFESRVILNRLKSFEEAELLARLKESVNPSKIRMQPNSPGHGLVNRNDPATGAYGTSQDPQQQRITELEGQVQLLICWSLKTTQLGYILLFSAIRSQQEKLTQ